MSTTITTKEIEQIQLSNDERDLLARAGRDLVIGLRAKRQIELAKRFDRREVIIALEAHRKEQIVTGAPQRLPR